jgi:hypothetical protein
MLYSLTANVFGFLTSHPGIVLVLVGVAGEIVCEWKHGKWFKKAFWVMVVLGLALEIPDAAKTDKEAAGLRLKADELELQMQPRTITAKQKEDFIRLVSSSPKGPLKIGSRNPDNEMNIYANQIGDMLADSGFTVVSRVNYPGNLIMAPSGTSVGVCIDKVDDAPRYAFTVFNALTSIGVPTIIVTNMPQVPKTFDYGAINTTNDMMIFIFEKQ